MRDHFLAATVAFIGLILVLTFVPVFAGAWSVGKLDNTDAVLLAIAGSCGTLVMGALSVVHVRALARGLRRTQRQALILR